MCVCAEAAPMPIEKLKCKLNEMKKFALVCLMENAVVLNVVCPLPHVCVRKCWKIEERLTVFVAWCVGWRLHTAKVSKSSLCSFKFC